MGNKKDPFEEDFDLEDRKDKDEDEEEIEEDGW